MKNIIALLSLTLITIYAEEVSIEKTHKLHIKHAEASPFYLTLKPMITTGDKKQEGENKLSGDNAYGVGIDAGYYVHPRISLELSTTYSRNTVTETNNLGEKEDGSARYTSAAINIVYKQPIFEDYALFAKLGYEWEHEKINFLNINEDEFGVDYAIGATHELSHHIAILIEYESSTINGLRGDAFFAGLEYRF